MDGRARANARRRLNAVSGEIARDRSHLAPVRTREELIYLLSRASELEHGLACVYLYAAHSLKSDADEGGLTPARARRVRAWKRTLGRVAVEEMLHLAQVTNLLTAIGGAPHFRRTNFPLPPGAFAFGLELSLEPVSADLLDRLVCYELPEPGVLDSARASAFEVVRARVARARTTHDTVPPERAAGEPFDVDFRTVGEFYHKIASGFATISAGRLFIGPREAQADGRVVAGFRDLVPVVDRASALGAIASIVERGEAPTVQHPVAHFTVFDELRRAYEREGACAAAAGEPFVPARAIVANPTTRHHGDRGGYVIGDELTHDVADLYDVAYDTMLLMLSRFFARSGESAEERQVLSRATIRIMHSVLRPLGEALTKLPAGAPYPGLAAGPSFGYNRDVELLPHKAAAWIFFCERLWALSARATEIASYYEVPDEFEAAAAALHDVAKSILLARRRAYFAAACGPGTVDARWRMTSSP